ncbi:hypothetical protein B0H16DRAFT_1449999 [Mycena metata]|uniref:Uncharacterized protein n=1 Tax=Mycena metata TaxID=1033252 RepID=A0AAD7JZT9_9AGAR|nr:hypothetical protein B0H16DRAFT_1449999 [Mycena metata]
MAKSTQWGRLELRISQADLAAFDHPGPFPILQTLAIGVTEVRGTAAWGTDLAFVPPFNDNGAGTPDLRDGPRFCLEGRTIPTLRHLDALLFEGLGPTSITSFLARSACILTHLTLRAPGGDRWCDYFGFSGKPCNPSLLLECLQAVPSVVNMSLLGDEALYPVFHRDDILPRLPLRLTSWPSTTVHAAFLAVLRARPALHSAELHVFHRVGEATRPPNEDVLADLSMHAAGGTHISLTTRSVGRFYREFEVNPEECENAEGA